jgi:hypothetical protein
MNEYILTEMKGQENRLKKSIKTLERIDKNINTLINELKWLRKYEEYVYRVYQNIDAEASGYADGDEEYMQSFNQNANNL